MTFLLPCSSHQSMSFVLLILPPKHISKVLPWSPDHCHFLLEFLQFLIERSPCFCSDKPPPYEIPIHEPKSPFIITNWNVSPPLCQVLFKTLLQWLPIVPTRFPEATRPGTHWPCLNNAPSSLAHHRLHLNWPPAFAQLLPALGPHTHSFIHLGLAGSCSSQRSLVSMSALSNHLPWLLLLLDFPVTVITSQPEIIHLHFFIFLFVRHLPPPDYKLHQIREVSIEVTNVCPGPNHYT